MSVREEFVLRAKAGEESMSSLCAEFGISRKTGYKWVERYEQRGFRGLEEMSRRPHSSPLQTSADVVAEVVALRRVHPRWGARKLIGAVHAKYGRDSVSLRTVNRILERTGFFQPRRRRKASRNGPCEPPKLSPEAPNDLWTVDYKGWWLSKQGERCEPLTIRDAHSRFVLEIAVLPGTGAADARQVFEKVFSTYGIPKAILSDNGSPFACSQGKVGLTQLSAWWLSLGIEHHRTRPGKPQDNGAHERLHKDIADELERFAALNRKEQQEACDRWRHDFNHHRPHEALGMKMPFTAYKRSSVEFTGQEPMLEYPGNHHVRKVNKAGWVKHKGKSFFLSWALAGKEVGFEPQGQKLFTVWFAHRRLGEVDTSLQKPVLVC